jgi:hypothetical protein
MHIIEVIKMPNGWGIGRGYWRRSYWWGPGVIATGQLKGYYYIGPCRCGFGPHAYYQTPDGRILHASQLTSVGIPATAPLGPQALKTEDESKLLEERYATIQEQIKILQEELKTINEKIEKIREQKKSS